MSHPPSTSHTRATPAALWGLQWSLAAVLFLLGLLQAGLPVEQVPPQLRVLVVARPWLPQLGLLEALAAVALVVPSATAFVPRLSLLAAAGLACALAADALGGARLFLPAALGWPLVDLALAVGCGAVLVGRGLLHPVAPLPLGPEPSAPGRTTPGGSTAVGVRSPACNLQAAGT
jgi:hypothetical protein